MTPAMEAASSSGKGDRGWDPCCIWDSYTDASGTTLKCRMGPNSTDSTVQWPVWDPVGPTGRGTWCWSYDFRNNGGTCKRTDGGWSFWTGGFVMDSCPGGSAKQCVHTGDGGSAADAWADGQWWPDASWTPTEKIEAKCGTSEAKPTCNDGWILAPNTDGSCPYSEWWSPRIAPLSGLKQCWPIARDVFIV